MDKLTVRASSKTYDILVGWDTLGSIGGALKERSLIGNRPIAVLTSPRIGGLYFDALEAGLRDAGIDNPIGRHDIPDGEANKNVEEWSSAVSWLADFVPQSSAKPLVMTLGGGVVGDLGGFVASSFRRGVPFVQVTTTLLGATDCSVGGKVAVNLPQGKNLVGAFYQPEMVFADLKTLQTLPDEQIRSGMAEVIKYGAVCDGSLFGYLEDNIDRLMDLSAEELSYTVRECCRIKADVVRQDEYDNKHVRICLNFGHTVGHAIEKACGFRMTHGACVAVGMVAAARISRRLDHCTSDDMRRLVNLLDSAGLPTECPHLDLEAEEVHEAMQHDKKWTEGVNVFVLMTGVGSWVERRNVDQSLIDDAVEYVLG